MASGASNLESLPTELLSQCISYLTDFLETDIKNLRLVSKRLHSGSSPFLKTSARVFVSSESLHRFEAMYQHPIFSKSITDIEINLSYFDSRLAAQKSLYGWYCGAVLLEYFANFDQVHYSPVLGRISTAADEWWSMLDEPERHESSYTENGRYLLRLYEEYVRLFKDQESVKRDGEHIRRICTALEKLQKVKKIEIRDKLFQRNPGPQWDERSI